MEFVQPYSGEKAERISPYLFKVRPLLERT